MRSRSGVPFSAQVSSVEFFLFGFGVAFFLAAVDVGVFEVVALPRLAPMHHAFFPHFTAAECFAVGVNVPNAALLPSFSFMKATFVGRLIPGPTFALFVLLAFHPTVSPRASVLMEADCLRQTKN